MHAQQAHEIYEIINEENDGDTRKSGGLGHVQQPVPQLLLLLLVLLLRCDSWTENRIIQSVQCLCKTQ